MSVAPPSYQQRYSGFAKSLHWIVALLVLTIIPVGIAMGQIENAPFNLYNFHKSLGVLILVLMTVRLIYRLVHGVPPEPKIPAFYRIAGTVTHWALYVLLFLTPISGANTLNCSVASASSITVARCGSRASRNTDCAISDSACLAK